MALGYGESLSSLQTGKYIFKVFAIYTHSHCSLSLPHTVKSMRQIQGLLVVSD